MSVELGPGTERLGTLVPGEDAWVVGPLGIGFGIPARAPVRCWWAAESPSRRW